jgi:hypothetical protein
LADESAPKFRIKNGNVEVEAPSKQDCIDLYQAATVTAQKYPINEALR